jgi:hypothetical protein
MPCGELAFLTNLIHTTTARLEEATLVQEGGGGWKEKEKGRNVLLLEYRIYSQECFVFFVHSSELHGKRKNGNMIKNSSASSR